MHALATWAIMTAMWLSERAEAFLSEPELEQEPASYVMDVRLTYYLLEGRTYSGGHTYPGSAACSTNFALGTRFRLPDGDVVVCNDRGLLGRTGWLDVWGRPDLPRRYGNYVTVEVLE
jgi:hypothetical protein